MQEWRLTETAAMKSRLNAKPKSKVQLMDESSWEKWARFHKRKYHRSRRDRDIWQVYRAEVLRRGFRSQVPIRFADPTPKVRDFYPLLKLLKAA